MPRAGGGCLWSGYDAATCAYTTGRPAALVLAGVWVGLAFQTKMLQSWLVLPAFRASVLGFDVAHVGHGGEGALYVRLRKGRT